MLADLRTAIAHGTFFPIVPVSPLTGAGVEELLGIIERAFPDPTIHPLPAVTSPWAVPSTASRATRRSRSSPRSCARRRDPYVGRLSLVRVFSGTLRVDEPVHVSGHLGDFVGHEVAGHPAHDDDERVGPLASPFVDDAPASWHRHRR